MEKDGGTYELTSDGPMALTTTPVRPGFLLGFPTMSSKLLGPSDSVLCTFKSALHRANKVVTSTGLTGNRINTPRRKSK